MQFAKIKAKAIFRQQVRSMFKNSSKMNTWCSPVLRMNVPKLEKPYYVWVICILTCENDIMARICLWGADGVPKIFLRGFDQLDAKVLVGELLQTFLVHVQQREKLEKTLR